VYAALARQIAQYADPMKPPVALISGGECTVTVRGKRARRRCSEFLLFPRIRTRRHPNVLRNRRRHGRHRRLGRQCGCGTPAEFACARARLGLDARKLLADNDAVRVFFAAEDLVVTGPTRTNVNDYRAILIR